MDNKQAYLSIDIYNVDFIQNVLKSDHYRSSKGSGAAIYVSINLHAYRISVRADTVIFLNNTSEGNGGAMAFRLPASVTSVTITGCVFENNRAGRINQGGGVHMHFQLDPNDPVLEFIPPAVTIENSNFTENVAGQGGSLYLETSSDMKGSLVVNNSNIVCCNEE